MSVVAPALIVGARYWTSCVLFPRASVYALVGVPPTGGVVSIWSTPGYAYAVRYRSAPKEFRTVAVVRPAPSYWVIVSDGIWLSVEGTNRLPEAVAPAQYGLLTTQFLP